MAQIVYKKPTLSHIPQMQRLVEGEVANGVILPRSDDEIATNIRSYTVAADADDNIVGYVALHIHSPRLAEVRSLVVGAPWRGRGIGRRLVELALEEGKSLGVRDVLALTYSKEFFERLGFNEIQKSDIPEHKIWQDCIKCKHFPVCNEVAMMRGL